MIKDVVVVVRFVDAADDVDIVVIVEVKVVADDVIDGNTGDDDGIVVVVVDWQTLKVEQMQAFDGKVEQSKQFES
jgi:hypothetical protein